MRRRLREAAATITFPEALTPEEIESLLDPLPVSATEEEWSAWDHLHAHAAVPKPPHGMSPPMDQPSALKVARENLGLRRGHPVPASEASCEVGKIHIGRFFDPRAWTSVRAVDCVVRWDEEIGKDILKAHETSHFLAGRNDGEPFAVYIGSSYSAFEAGGVTKLGPILWGLPTDVDLPTVVSQETVGGERGVRFEVVRLRSDTTETLPLSPPPNAVLELTPLGRGVHLRAGACARDPESAEDCPYREWEYKVRYSAGEIEIIARRLEAK